MKAKELALQLLKNPDFDIEFSFSEKDNSKWGITVRSFEDVKIDDIGYSDCVILLGGDEK